MFLFMERYKATANPERNRAMIELRRSGAAGTHADKRARRIRTRQAAKTRAKEDQADLFIVNRLPPRVINTANWILVEC